jgi:hypothetical protein
LEDIVEALQDDAELVTRTKNMISLVKTSWLRKYIVDQVNEHFASDKFERAAATGNHDVVLDEAEQLWQEIGQRMHGKHGGVIESGKLTAADKRVGRVRVVLCGCAPGTRTT